MQAESLFLIYRRNHRGRAARPGPRWRAKIEAGFRDRVRTAASRGLLSPLWLRGGLGLGVGQEPGQVERDGGQGELDFHFLQSPQAKPPHPALFFERSPNWFD